MSAGEVRPANAEEALHALTQGRYGDAVRAYEALADEGTVDATLSFNRGLAYAGKLSLAQSEAGDFGQAVAAFRETERLSGVAETRQSAQKMLQALEAAPHPVPVATLEDGGTAVWTAVERLPALPIAATGTGVLLVALALYKRIRGGSVVPVVLAGAACFTALSLLAAQTYERSRGAHAVVIRTFSAEGLSVLEGTSVRVHERSGARSTIETSEGTYQAPSGVLRVLQDR
jgi:hypothetical protein